MNGVKQIWQIVDRQFETEFYDPHEVTSPDKTKTITMSAENELGIMNINNETVLKFDRIHRRLHVYDYPKWLPDNEHIIMNSNPDKTIRIFEPSTKKIAIFAQGVNAKFIGQYEGMPVPSVEY